MTQDYEYCEECGEQVVKAPFICENCLVKMKSKETEKSKLFPSRKIKGMLTDGQGAYYPNDKIKMKTQKAIEKEEKHFLSDFGFCKHKWKFIRIERSSYLVKDVCECIKCGKRKGFKVW